MQLELFSPWTRRRSPPPECLIIGSKLVPIEFLRHRRAKRYVLRLRRDGSVRVTIPRGGSVEFATHFAQKHVAWIERQLSRRTEERHPVAWTEGSEFLLRGELVMLRTQAHGEAKVISFADHAVTVPRDAANLRPAVERYLWRLAEKELEPRTSQLAAQHQLNVRRVVVRNQRTRWGSCSARGTISLNWRLIQAPPPVRDYVIVHELMHLREMNHSVRFWRLVESAVPSYANAEAWLNAHTQLLR